MYATKSLLPLSSFAYSALCAFKYPILAIKIRLQIEILVRIKTNEAWVRITVETLIIG